MSTPVVILIFVVAVLAIGEFLLFGALAEAYRDLKQLREMSGILDRPTPIDLGGLQGAPASMVGLPEAFDDAPAAMALFVDSRCTTCRGIVSSLAGNLPEGVVMTAIAHSPTEAVKWLVHSGGFDMQALANAERIVISSPDEVRARLGIEITPLAIQIEHGRLARASTVPSVRQFYKQVPNGFTLPIIRTEGALS